MLRKTICAKLLLASIFWAPMTLFGQPSEPGLYLEGQFKMVKPEKADKTKFYQAVDTRFKKERDRKVELERNGFVCFYKRASLFQCEKEVKNTDLPKIAEVRLQREYDDRMSLKFSPTVTDIARYQGGESFTEWMITQEVRWGAQAFSKWRHFLSKTTRKATFDTPSESFSFAILTPNELVTHRRLRFRKKENRNQWMDVFVSIYWLK